MNDGVEAATVKLSELLRHPDDLDKIPALKAEFTRKKAAIDSQLRHGLKEQLEVTQAGMNSITDGQNTVNMIKEEMMKIDKLCAEAQNMIQDFPHINLVAATHRNFEQVEKMRRDIETFADRLESIEYLLGQDDEDPASQPNLLQIHFELTELRDIRDEALQQVPPTAEDRELIDNLTLDTGSTVQDYFARLDDVIEWFDKHIGEACINLIDLVQSGNDGMVVRLALVIEEEEKQDKKAKALQDAQREYKELATRFNAITGPKELRGYKDKFLKAIEYVCEANIAEANEKFYDDPTKMSKNTKWYFNNLNAVKMGMQTLMPKKWKIFRTYCNIYHTKMHDWLISIIDDEGSTPPQLLAIINWVDEYYKKMQKLGISEDELQPHLIDNRSAELVREYRQVIVKSVDDWMDRMADTDRKNFLSRNQEILDQDADARFRTKSLGDMWRMLSEQLAVAASSERTDVAEGVADAMFRALTARQRMWQGLIESEAVRLSNASNSEDIGPTLDFVAAIANDQLSCTAGNDEEDIPSYLDVFSRDIKPLVSPGYQENITAQIETLRNGYIDLAVVCIKTFVAIIFANDLTPVLRNFFTSEWYNKSDMLTITTTFRDYENDYRVVLVPSLADILVEELAEELLAQYLSAVKNKGAKFKRADPFGDKMRDDIMTVFQHFEMYPGMYEDIKLSWRAVNAMVELLQADKTQVQFKYEDIKMQFWDVQIGWVEAVLRARDDFERSMLNSVKAKAAEVNVERGLENTIFARVKVK